MQQRVISGLQLHLEHSQPAAAAAAAAPAWRLYCDSKALHMYVHSQLSNLDAAAAVAGDGGGASSSSSGGRPAVSAAAEAAGCSQQVQELWLLLQLLFEYIEGQDDDLEGDDDTAAAAAAANGDNMMDADMVGLQDGPMNSSSDGSRGGKQCALAGMQRKAALSSWLKQKLRPQVCWGGGVFHG
jgi:hypothetical protein